MGSGAVASGAGNGNDVPCAHPFSDFQRRYIREMRVSRHHAVAMIDIDIEPIATARFATRVADASRSHSVHPSTERYSYIYSQRMIRTKIARDRPNRRPIYDRYYSSGVFLWCRCRSDS